MRKWAAILALLFLPAIESPAPLDFQAHADVIRPVSQVPASPLEKPVSAPLLDAPAFSSEMALDGPGLELFTSVPGDLPGRLRPPFPLDIFRPPRRSR